MLRKNLSLLLAIITIFSILTIFPIGASAAKAEDLSETGASAELAETGWSVPSENAFATKLAELRKLYPSYGYSGVYYEDGVEMAWQCYGYCCIMFREIFGIKYYAEGWTSRVDYNMGTIYAGDSVRINNRHSIFITKVTDKGYYYTEGNWDGANGVRWNQFISKSDLAYIFTYKVHVPGNTLLGTGVAQTGLYAETPQLKNIKSTGSGIIVSWYPVEDATGYRVYCKENDQAHWKTVGKTDKTNFHYIADLKYLSTYSFTVRATDSYGNLISGYDTDGIVTDYEVNAPELKSAVTGVNKITVKWAAVSNVNYYRLYSKGENDTSWHIVANVKGTSGSFTTGKALTNYQFTVRCLSDSKQVISACSVNRPTAVFRDYATQLDAPSNIVAAATKEQGTIKISWDPVPNAKRYQVFVSLYGVNTGWKRLAKTTKNYYLQTGCVNNGLYRYTVRCIDDKGAFVSGYLKGCSIRYFRYPTTLKAVKADDDGNIKVSWSAVKGASSYALYYKTAETGGWQQVITDAPIKTNSYVFGGCISGTAYTFTVRACDNNGKKTSSYKADGVTLTYTSANQATAPTSADMTDTSFQ